MLDGRDQEDLFSYARELCRAGVRHFSVGTEENMKSGKRLYHLVIFYSNQPDEIVRTFQVWKHMAHPSPRVTTSVEKKEMSWDELRKLILDRRIKLRHQESLQALAQ